MITSFTPPWCCNTVSPIVCDPYNTIKFLLSVLRDHVLHSTRCCNTVSPIVSEPYNTIKLLLSALRDHVLLWRYPLGLQTHQLLRTISLLVRWSTSGPDRGIEHFFTATRNTIKGVGGKRTNEQTNNMPGVNSKCKTRSYATLCISCVHM